MMVIPVWALSLPLPAVLLVAVCAYMLVLWVALWSRHCFKVECGPDCCSCCGSVSVCDYCMLCAETWNCTVPSLRMCLDASCPAPACPQCSCPQCSCPDPSCPQCSPPSWPCGNMDLSCTCQRPQCDMINCFCFEIRFR
ncbi:hypothetical protein AALO_G00283790 [Alosa alosa]|uniref:Uncharacterized protein n=1 Tax=Alosa alosa TaxID=278164 RepID=A0AAV6FJZ2_9TELE|nr:guanine nucleotide-binding protein subunit gamma 4 [Alosa alosa]KAG5263208.1 hypothetical protein AALO_G00283790 [Alosa alosa]